MAENHPMPPSTRQDLDEALGTDDRVVYLVVGPAEGLPWGACKMWLGDYAASEHFCATNSAEVQDLTGKTGAIGWPEGTQWNGGIPAAVCFGWKSEPVFYLTKEQATDRATCKGAYKRARELTEEPE